LANYYETEMNETLAILSLEKAKEELQQFNDGYCEYEIDLRHQKQQTVGMIKDLRAIAEEELEDILLERVGIQDAVNGAKVFVLKTKNVVCRNEERGGELQGHRLASPCRNRYYPVESWNRRGCTVWRGTHREWVSKTNGQSRCYYEGNW
jgi:hypothetical protein